MGSRAFVCSIDVLCQEGGVFCSFRGPIQRFAINMCMTTWRDFEFGFFSRGLVWFGSVRIGLAWFRFYVRVSRDQSDSITRLAFLQRLRAMRMRHKIKLVSFRTFNKARRN